MKGLTRSLALAAVLVVGAACSNASTQSKQPTLTPRAPASAIPLPDTKATGTAIQLPGNAAGAVAATGPSIDDLYAQGKTDVLR